MSAPDLTVSEAVQATGASRRTLVRRLSERAFPGAYRGPGGAWRIPVADLIGAGFSLRVPEPVAEAQAEELADLRARLAEAESRAKVAEAVAEERLHALEDARLALRALTSGTAPLAAPEPATVPVVAEPAPPEPGGVVGRLRRFVGI